MTLIDILVIATIYHATPSQCNDDYLTTASGMKIECTDSAYKHRCIAVSRDLLGEFPYGTEVIVSGCEVEEYNGVWVVNDTMNKRYRRRVDFLVNPKMKPTNKMCMMRKVEKPKRCSLCQIPYTIQRRVWKPLD